MRYAEMENTIRVTVIAIGIVKGGELFSDHKQNCLLSIGRRFNLLNFISEIRFCLIDNGICIKLLKLFTEKALIVKYLSYNLSLFHR